MTAQDRVHKDRFMRTALFHFQRCIADGVSIESAADEAMEFAMEQAGTGLGYGYVTEAAARRNWVSWRQEIIAEMSIVGPCPDEQ